MFGGCCGQFSGKIASTQLTERYDRSASRRSSVSMMRLLSPAAARASSAAACSGAAPAAAATELLLRLLASEKLRNELPSAAGSTCKQADQALWCGSALAAGKGSGSRDGGTRRLRRLALHT